MTEIGAEAFAGQEINSVTLPATVESVDKNAFKDCKMTELNITGSVDKKMFAKNALKVNLFPVKDIKFLAGILFIEVFIY